MALAVAVPMRISLAFVCMANAVVAYNPVPAPATYSWTDTNPDTGYGRGEGIASYVGVGGNHYTCITGGTLTQLFGDNLDAASTEKSPWIRPGINTVAGTGNVDQSGRNTNKWEGCCMMQGTPKTPSSDSYVDDSATSVTTLDTGDTSTTLFLRWGGGGGSCFS